MINIEVRQGDPVKSPGHKLKYELVVEYMHGDADGTTYRTVHYTDDEHDEMLLDILGIIASSKSESDIYESKDDVVAIFESQGVEDAHDRVDQWSDSFYEGDITNEGEAAYIVGYELFWYDANGAKYHIDTLINGKKVS